MRQPWFRIYRQAFTQMMAAEIDTAYDTPPAAPGAASRNEAYIGTYANHYFGDIAIVAAGDGLALELGPERKRYPLSHYDRDVFTFATDGENSTAEVV